MMYPGLNRVLCLLFIWPLVFFYSVEQVAGSRGAHHVEVRPVLGEARGF